MNTITTTTKKFDLSAIMRRAWAIRRAAAAEMGCKVSAVLLGECLRLAWAEAEGEYADVNASSIVSEWAAMTPAQQIDMMKKCIHRAALNDIGYSSYDQYLQFEELPAFKLFGLHDLDEFVNETWLRITAKLADLDKLAAYNRKRASEGKRPTTLVHLVYLAAWASIRAVYNQDIRNGVTGVRTVIDADGQESSYVETMVKAPIQATDAAAIWKVTIERCMASWDDKNRMIWDLSLLGFTERQIAERVKISNVAVHKRKVKMHEAVKKALAA